MDMIPNRSKLQSALTDAHEFIIWSILGNNKKNNNNKRISINIQETEENISEGKNSFDFLSIFISDYIYRARALATGFGIIPSSLP